jgi:predicted NBD/HSP70 family sugar kinase
LPFSEDLDGLVQKTPFAWEGIIGKGSLLSAAKRRTNRKSLDGLRASVLRSEPAALELVETWARRLACGLTALAHVFDPEEIIIGGELASLFELTSKTVENELRKGLVANFPVPRLSASRFQSDGCAIGAAAIMHAQLFSAVSTEPVEL